MSKIIERSMIPIERFRNILGSLELPNDSIETLYWLRFAAQAAILRPEEPEQLAQLIRKTAQILDENTPWFSALSQSIRFAIAAILVQNHDSPCDFIKGHRHLSNLFRQQELRAGGAHETLAVIILRMNADKRRIHHQDITRFKAIYEEMKNFHWWLTGPDDFPAAAALSFIHGSAREVMQRAESVYQFLDQAGLQKGDGLQSASNLLPLINKDTGDAVSTFIELRSLLKKQGKDQISYHYDSLLPLVMLDHEPQHIMEMCLAIYEELSISQQETFGSSTFGIAADLCFLDLIRFDKDLKQRENIHDVQGMLSDIHRFHIITCATMSRFDPVAEGLFIKDNYDGWYI